MSGTLFVVATPLGNLGDLSPRAAEALATADALYAEDTRHSRILLEHISNERPLRSLHEHNERARTGEVLGLLAAGKSVALVSDAGTPALSDPGASLVSAAHAAGHRVSPIPGPSALAAAVSVAGFVAGADDVLFVGFLAARGTKRRIALERVARHRGEVVLYEPPHRLRATLDDLVELGADRPICLCRELTKVHEEVRRCTVAELRDGLGDEVRGEVTLVLGPDPGQGAAEQDVSGIDAALRRCLDAGISKRDAAAAVAAVLQLRKRDVYSRCLKI